MYTVKAHFQILDHCRYAQLTLCGNETFNRRLKMSHEGTAPVSLLDLLICFCRAHGRDKQTDRPRYMRSNRPHLYVCIAMRAKNYSERRHWRHQFRGQHEWNKARCKRVVVAVGNCTRAMCVRARRSQCSSTESARSPPLRLYIPGQFVRWSRRVIFADLRTMQSTVCLSPASVLLCVRCRSTPTPHTYAVLPCPAQVSFVVQRNRESTNTYAALALRSVGGLRLVRTRVASGPIYEMSYNYLTIILR